MVDSHDAETYSAKDSRLIWIDCEMTGLDIFGGDELVEVSVVPTDFDLNVLDEGVDYVIKPSEKAVNHMNDFVRQMHTRSGLINEWENGLSLAEAEQYTQQQGALGEGDWHGRGPFAEIQRRPF